MNDIPQDLVLVAERLSRALAADGDTIERDVVAQLGAAPLPVAVGEMLDIGPVIDIDIDARPNSPRRRSRRSQHVFAIAAVVVVALAVVVSVEHRDSNPVVTGTDGERYFLPGALPGGYVLNGADSGVPSGQRAAVQWWRRVYTERDGGGLRRLLIIDSVTPFTTIVPPTVGQPLVVAGRSAAYTTNQGISVVWFGNDFGCGYVSIAAIGYEAGSAPPADLLDELASIACAPTATGGQAAAVAVPPGFTLEDDNDDASGGIGWGLSYSRGGLSPLSFSFNVSDPAPDVTVTVLAGSATKVVRNGRDYWTAAVAPGGSRAAFVAWTEGSYRILLSSAEVGLDDLLAIADGVHEVDKATFDDATRSVLAIQHDSDLTGATTTTR